MSRDPLRHRIDWDVLEARICPSQSGLPTVVPVERTDVYGLTRYAEDLQQVASGRDGVVILGDSIADWWANGAGASVWGRSLGRINAADFGVAGDTAENLLWRVENGELAGAPRVAVVEIGTNNLGYDEPVDCTVSAIEAVIDAIRSPSPTTQVVLMGLLPRGSTFDPLRAEVDQVNAELAAWAPRAGAGFLDINGFLTTPDGSLAVDFQPDQVHPNAVGYMIWAATVEGVVLGLLDATAAVASHVTRQISSTTGEEPASSTADSPAPPSSGPIESPGPVAQATGDPASTAIYGVEETATSTRSSAVGDEQAPSGSQAASDSTSDVATEPPVTTARVGQSTPEELSAPFVDELPDDMIEAGPVAVDPAELDVIAEVA